jgi:hypothetical protein
VIYGWPEQKIHSGYRLARLATRLSGGSSGVKLAPGGHPEQDPPPPWCGEIRGNAHRPYSSITAWSWNFRQSG